jgi:microcystin degradation protein MlrC
MSSTPSSMSNEKRPWRVAVGMLNQETNQFSPVETTLASWQHHGWATGDEVAIYRDSDMSMAGFWDVADREGWEVVGTLCAMTLPSQQTQADDYAYMKELLLQPLRHTAVDGILLFMHGAMMAEGTPDVEGDICRAVKEIAPDTPLMVAMDLHGNISPEMCAHCDGVFAFDTNPHIDMRERGQEAAECMKRVLAGEVRPVVGYAHPPMMPPTINMRTTEGPMAELRRLAEAWEEKEGILNVSVFGGFPYCDFENIGLSVVVTADGDMALAQTCADELAAYAWEHRTDFLKTIPTVEEAIEQTLTLLAAARETASTAVASAAPGSASAAKIRPILLADVADNPTGGGSGDTTELLRELLRRGVQGVAAAAIVDPETVQRALQVGVGHTAEFAIGGKVAPQFGEPLVVTGRVRTLTDGKFRARGPFGGDWTLGPTAVIEVDGIRFVVITERKIAHNADLFRHVGIDPADTPVLVVKSRGHFRASFEPLVGTIIEVDAPGPANPNIRRLPYQHVPRPIWPLDPL